VATFRRLLSDRVFLGYPLASGLAFAAMFAYISGSPFVLQEICGVMQFAIGAVAAPLAGIAGLTALPMAAVIVALSAGALAVLALLGPESRPQDLPGFHA